MLTPYNPPIEGNPVISHEILAAYAGDAARGVDGVGGLFEGPLHRKPVRITGDDGAISVELHLAVEWGAHVPTVGHGVQDAVAEYLERMAGLRPLAVDVIVDDVEAPGASASG